MAKRLAIFMGALTLLVSVGTAGAVGIQNPPKPPPSSIVRDLSSKLKKSIPAAAEGAPSAVVPKSIRDRIRDRHAPKLQRILTNPSPSAREALETSPTSIATGKTIYPYGWVYGGSSGAWNLWWFAYYDDFGPDWIYDAYWQYGNTDYVVRAGYFCRYYINFYVWGCYYG